MYSVFSVVPHLVCSSTLDKRHLLHSVETYNRIRWKPGRRFRRSFPPVGTAVGFQFDEHRCRVLSSKTETVILDRNDARAAGLNHSHVDSVAKPHFRQPVDKIPVTVNLTDFSPFTNRKQLQRHDLLHVIGPVISGHNRLLRLSLNSLPHFRLVRKESQLHDPVTVGTATGTIWTRFRLPVARSVTAAFCGFVGTQRVAAIRGVR